MKINFLLPEFSHVPVGGVKVVYQYANGMAKRGHTVRVIHPPWCNIKDPVSPANYARQQVKMAMGPLAARRLIGSKIGWFPMDERVEQIIVPDLRERNIPNADATIASAWTTADWAASYSHTKGAGYYLIQHYEAWDGHNNAVDRTWQLPLHKIVIAKWLKEKAAELGEAANTTYIPNGLDFERFYIQEPIDKRSARIAMLGHKADWKGTPDGIRALQKVRGILPSVTAIVFGTDPRPNDLPEWIEYNRLPAPDELTRIYNSSSIFLHPSWTEGWPLPPSEAMACGCALVATANSGVLDYATDNLTALVAPLRDSDALADRIMELLTNDSRRIKIAEAGNLHIKSFTWDRAEGDLEALLLRGTSAE
jgi:glycosyltransferase involved in cell wall biosynthesis